MSSPRDAATTRRRVGRRTRAFGTWAVSYGVTGLFFRGAAARGDEITRLETDRRLWHEPWDALDRLRERGPLVPGPVAYATASHGTLTRVLRSDAFTTLGQHDELPRPLAAAFARLSDPWAASPVDPPSMLATDGATHARYRKLVSRAFTARAVSGMEGRIERVAEGLLDDLEQRHQGRPGRLDLVEEYAALLPLAVIADLLGVPDHMHGRLLAWGNAAARTLDPALSWRGFREADVANGELHRWFAQHIDHLRAQPGDDLLSGLVALHDDDQLTDLELRATGLLVLGAGFETTVNLIGNAVALLDAHRDQLDALRDRPEGWANAVEEVLRFDAPVQVTARVAAADTTLDGVEVPRRTPVLLHLAGANRDPEVFTDPHRFDVTRTNAREHLAFSSGAHFCLGAGLARKEAEVGLRRLYERFPDLRVTAPGVRRDTRVLRGFERLDVDLGRGRARRPAAPAAAGAGSGV